MAKIDRYGNELQGLGFGHFIGHAEKLYQATISLAGVAAATTTDIQFTTPATLEAHIGGLRARHVGTWTLSLIEAPTGVTGGAVVTPWNRYRPSTKTASSVIKSAVTGTTGGTVLLLGRLLAATGIGNRATLGGADGGWDDEIVLKPNTTYVIRTLTGATTGNELDLDLVFAELA
jgi:hypothetical protein